MTCSNAKTAVGTCVPDEELERLRTTLHKEGPCRHGHVGAWRICRNRSKPRGWDWECAECSRIRNDIAMDKSESKYGVRCAPYKLDENGNYTEAFKAAQRRYRKKERDIAEKLYGVRNYIWCIKNPDRVREIHRQSYRKCHMIAAGADPAIFSHYGPHGHRSAINKGEFV